MSSTGRAVLIAGTGMSVALWLSSVIGPTENLHAVGTGATINVLLATGAAVVVMPAVLALLGGRTFAWRFGAPALLSAPWRNRPAVRDPAALPTRELFMRNGRPHESLAHGLRETAGASTGAAVVMVAAIVPFAMSDFYELTLTIDRAVDSCAEGSVLSRDNERSWRVFGERVAALHTQLTTI